MTSNPLQSWKVSAIIGVFALLAWVVAFSIYFYGVFRFEKNLRDLLSRLWIRRKS